MSDPRKKLVKVNAMSYAILVAHMLDGKYDNQQLAGMTGLHYRTVCQYTRELLKHHAAFVCDWHPDAKGRRTLAVVSIGHGLSVPRPRYTPAQRQARHRAKKRKEELAQQGLGVFHPKPGVLVHRSIGAMK